MKVAARHLQKQQSHDRIYTFEQIRLGVILRRNGNTLTGARLGLEKSDNDSEKLEAEFDMIGTSYGSEENIAQRGTPKVFGQSDMLLNEAPGKTRQSISSMSAHRVPHGF
jgi:hypothetical protein